MTRAILAALALGGAGCVTLPAVNPGVQLRPETRQECVTHCKTLGMRLSAIVLVRNAAGCVCAEGDAAQGAGGGAAVNAGAYLVALEEEEEQRRQQSMQQSAQHSVSGAPGSPGWHP